MIRNYLQLGMLSRPITRRQFLGGVMIAPFLGQSHAPAAIGYAEEAGPDAESASDLVIDAAFPGGNILVERSTGDTVYLSQDLRDTEGWWFYWYFRLCGGQGRNVTFQFTNKDVFTCRGPAVKIGGGAWSWLGRQSVQGTSFTFSVPQGANEVRFCLAMPYLEEDLQRFLNAHANNPHLKVVEHCVTQKGRRTERLHLGCLGERPRHRVLIACRHHACEMMASWVLEGLAEAVLTGPHAPWLCQNVEFAIIPFMDKDGVEDGDQGKNRRPHDHNRDYQGEPIYPSVRANKEFAPKWSEGRLHVALDLHCPYIRGRRDEEIFLVGSPFKEIQQEIDRFGEILRATSAETLPYEPRNNIPFGVEWNNTPPESARTFSRWASSLEGIKFATTLEFPYACAGGKVVNVSTSRAFGRSLAAALRQYLETIG
ncbi:MAG: M14 family zinc carboxypeptidase [Thermogutta sp.]